MILFGIVNKMTIVFNYKYQKIYKSNSELEIKHKLRISIPSYI